MTPNSEWTDIGREVQGGVAISNGASIRLLSGENDPREGGGRQLIAFNWAVAKIGDKEYRVNGQHSSAVLSELNGEFPQGLKVHMDTYEVDSNDGLALLFRQFDSRKSGHTPTDV
jgi:hypothetical protein